MILTVACSELTEPFQTIGMFNALNGLGGGGKQDATTADK